jgi:hypothetical protein
MPKLIIAFLFGLMLVACQAGVGVTQTQSGAPYGIPHVKRPTLLVADLERSLTVYRDVLGFEAGAVVDASPDSFSYPVR